jgi:hypothetical protein
MNTIKQFFKTVYSVLSLNLYQERKNVPGALTFGPAFRYLFACVALFSVLFAFSAVPIAFFLVKLAGQLPSYYPQDLVLTLTNGKATSNINPYIVPMDPKPSQPRLANQPKNFVTINTDKKFTLDDFRAADSAIYIASDYFGALKGNSTSRAGIENGAVQVQSYNGINVTLSRPTVQAFVTSALELKPVLFIFLPIAFFIGALLGITVGTLVIALISAALVLLYAKIRSIEITYKTAYATTLFAATFALAIRIFFLLAGINPFTFFYTFLTAIMVIIMLERAQAQTQNPGAPAQPINTVEPRTTENTAEKSEQNVDVNGVNSLK